MVEKHGSLLPYMVEIMYNTTTWCYRRHGWKMGYNTHMEDKAFLHGVLHGPSFTLKIDLMHTTHGRPYKI